jgi:hypothetical protein
VVHHYKRSAAQLWSSAGSAQANGTRPREP